MPQIDQPHDIRAILNHDRPWSAYALGDLEPALFAKCVWFFAADSLALVYLGFDITVLVALGNDNGWQETKAFLGPARDLYVAVRPAVMEHLHRHHVVHVDKPMSRMVLHGPLSPTNEASGVRRLRRMDGPALQRLFQTGAATGEVPEFFREEMLDSGVYFGVWDGAELTAAGGTHLVVPAESVAALGNIFTRADRRGQGLGTKVTQAVAQELVDRRIQTIVLNVRRDNESARRIYQRLGFRYYCPYFEAVIVT